jgi:hypothetical protein
MGIPGCGNRPLTPPRPPGGFRGGQAPIVHAWSGVVDAGQVAACCHRGDGHGARHAAPGLPRLNDRVQTPGGHVRVAGLCQTLPPFRVCGDRADICLKDHGLRRGRADDVAEPAAVGRAPGGPAGRAPIVPQPKGLQPQCGGLEVADGFIVHGGDSDGGEVP